MASRWGKLAFVVVSASVLGCGPGLNRPGDPARRRWQETGRRCRGELLLVDRGDVQDAHHPHESTDYQTEPEGIPARAIEAARRFTVAIRATQATARSDARAPLAAAACATYSPDQQLSKGSGMVIDPRGLILTNEHVISGADHIEVHITGAGWLRARLVGADPQSDLAVLDVARTLPDVCRFAENVPATAGQPVAAIGHLPDRSIPGKPSAITGCLCARQRCLQGELDPAQKRSYANMLESSIPLPKGCSGGPLIDAQARVIGVNTAALSDRRTGGRHGYAIPITTRIRSIIGQLARGETVQHGFLGLLVRVARGRQTDQDSTAKTGILVERVLADSPAGRAGIQSGDFIARVGGVEVANASELAEQVRAAGIGRKLSITVDRDGRPLTLVATPTLLAQRPTTN